MIIGFDASRAFINKKTGTENYSYQILKHLLHLDHNNKYWVYSRPNIQSSVLGCRLSDIRPEGLNPKEKGLSVISSSVKKSETDRQKTGKQISENRKQKTDNRIITIPFPRLWTQAGLALQTFKDPLDILFVPAHTLPLIRKPGLKTVVTVHDLGAEFLPGTHQLKQKLYLNLMTHYQLKTATHIIAVSETTKNDLVKKVKIPVEKISVVYEGYNKDLFKPVKGNTLSHTLSTYNLEPSTYHLFVGTIQPRKNLERLIRAYAKSVGFNPCVDPNRKGQDPQKQPTLVLAGSKGWLAEDIYRLPKELGIEKQVKFLGYVPDKDLPALYSGAIAFLFPSLFEGFGLPILEAMACGCPVLTSNLGSMKEISGSAALLVDPSSEKDIAQGIKRIKDKELRIKLAKAGLGQVKNFSWEKAAKETLEVFRFLSPKNS